MLLVHPQLDFADEVVRILGWPTLIAVVAWVVRKWDKNQRDLKSIVQNSQTAVAAVAVVDQKLDKIKDNHLAHLQAGIEQVAQTNEQAVVVLTNIDKGIAVLVDRSSRV